MSIITEALNRLQAERARRAGQPRSSVRSESADVVDSQPPDFRRPQRFRLFSIIVVLGGVGMAAYLWGLPLLADLDKVRPEHKAVQTLNPMDHVQSRIAEAIQPEKAFTAALMEESKASKSMKAASATGANPSIQGTSTVAKRAPARNPRSFPGIPSTTEPPPVPDANVSSSDQRKPPISSLLRNVTPLQLKLARAQYFIKKRRYARAVAVLQPLFEEPPEPWEPWFWLGTAQLGLGQWEKAWASLVEGLARDATVPQLWVQRALVSQQQGRFAEALDALRQAELLAPRLPKVQLNLAYSLDAQGNPSAAVKHYRQFLSLTEGQKAYHATRKKVLDRLGSLWIQAKKL